MQIPQIRLRGNESTCARIEFEDDMAQLNRVRSEAVRRTGIVMAIFQERVDVTS